MFWSECGYGTVNVTFVLCTRLPETPVTVKVYVPAVAGVVVVVPPPPVPVELLELLPPQPTAVRAATESTAARSAPQRRRRGNANNSTQARVAPDPAAYHGVLPDGIERGAFSDAVVLFT
jgi:hypothetical protein